MNATVKTLALAGLLAAGNAVAQYSAVRYVEAPVVGYEPVHATEQVPVEHEVCWHEREYRRHGNRATGTIAGAIIGGVIGNQFGDGSGQKLLTAAGAALGASVGHGASRGRHAHPRQVERCEVQVDYETRSYISGYNVRYRYGGEVYETFTEREPGRYIRLEVKARPVG